MILCGVILDVHLCQVFGLRAAATADKSARQGGTGERNMPFCETNPPILRWKTVVIIEGCKELRWKLMRENGGFVLENEPTGRG